MTNSVIELIKRRKSVRSFNNQDIADSDRKRLEEYIGSLKNPFDVRVDFCILDAEDNKLSSPVIVGATAYIAAKVRRVGNYELAYGYSFEKLCLYALSLGIGTVMLAASLDRKAFERAMNLQNDEVLPVASPIGYPADKSSIREKLMRKGLKADERIPFNKLFFEGTFEKELGRETAGIFYDALEMLRLSPSAGNKQPWRAIVDGEKVHFYEKKSLKDSTLGDIQKLDMGIALAHFDMTMDESGNTGGFVFENPGISSPEDTFYIATYVIK